MQPLLTVGLAAVLLGQLVSARDFGAMLIILAGVALVIRAKLADDRRRWRAEDSDCCNVNQRPLTLPFHSCSCGAGHPHQAGRRLPQVTTILVLPLAIASDKG